ncbi:MAG: shikimate dehydrogenase, partial [Thiohalophilus sp.]
MSDLFDFSRRHDNYAVMGNPIAHSKSPRIHTLFAEQTGEPVHYEAIQVDPGGFAQAVGNFDASGGKGLNITVPFKQEAWELVNERSERAERAGAVNTIRFGEGKLFGDNTDGIGLVNDLLNNQIVIRDKRILLMGAGGAARGVLAPL